MWGSNVNLNSAYQLSAREEDVEMEGNFIEKVGTQFCVRSHNTADSNFGCFPSREEAEAKLRTIMGTKVEAGQYGQSGWQYGRRMHIGYIPQRTISGFPRNPGSTGMRRRSGGSGMGMGSRLPSGGMGRSIGRGARLEGYGTSEGVTKEWDTRGRKGWMSYPLKAKLYGIDKLITDPAEHDRLKALLTNDPMGVESNREVKKVLTKAASKQGYRGFVYSEGELKAEYGEPMTGNMSHSHIDPVVWFHPPSLSSRYKNEDLRIPTDNPRETNDKFMDVTKRNSKETNEQRMKLLKRSSPGPQVPVRTTAIEPHSGVYQPSALFGSSWPARGRQGRNFTSYDRRGVL